MRSESITLGTRNSTLVAPTPFFQNRFAKEGAFRKFRGTNLKDTYYERIESERIPQRL
jgi:hypothetical protein